MQLVQNAGRRHLMMDDTYDAIWADSLMPLELLTQQVSALYMAVIDRSAGSIGECMDEGYISTSFGSVILDAGTGTASIESAAGVFPLFLQPDADVHAVVLNKQTGEVLYERAVKL